MGSAEIPHVFRDAPVDIEVTKRANTLFSTDLLSLSEDSLNVTEDLAPLEGPYPEADFPLFRWAKSPVVRLAIPSDTTLSKLTLAFSIRIYVRDSADLDVRLNGRTLADFHIEGSDTWFSQTLEIPITSAENILELRDVTISNQPDWDDYLNRYPDVKDYLISEDIPLEKGARDHYTDFGEAEKRLLFMKRFVQPTPPRDSLYYAYRTLKIEGMKSQ